MDTSLVNVGTQSFDTIRNEGFYFIDKTYFIKEWWDSKDEVTLITRPRRFGKTTNMKMLECFFSNAFENRGDLFEGLRIWDYEDYRALQGTYPLIFISFASIKVKTFEKFLEGLNTQIIDVYRKFSFLKDSDCLSENEKEYFRSIKDNNMNENKAIYALNILCSYLSRYYGKKVIILLDEYDTPMQEAYVDGYWDQLTGFLCGFFNATFKTNWNLERAILTGVTRISKESVFSDLNNLNVITTTSKQYSTCFGFTEEEVLTALQEFELLDEKDEVKRWYDGFTFGESQHIYNPLSVVGYLKCKTFDSYWANTSSNTLISNLCQHGSAEMKMQLESLLKQKPITVPIDEQIVFNQLDRNQNAIWGLLLASGYLTVDKIQRKNEYGETLAEPLYTLSLTNYEVQLMFTKMVQTWFASHQESYNGFIQAFLKIQIEDMNAYMNDIALTTFSSFDIGKRPSQSAQPERFYHGFVLGLLVDLKDQYIIASNRESGYGRYDIMMIPKNKNGLAFVVEFKVQNSKKESSLSVTADNALNQIEDRQYDKELEIRGVNSDKIVHYGFAFSGKQVLIKSNREPLPATEGKLLLF